MELQVGLMDIGLVRMNADRIEDINTKQTILAMCDVIDILLRNMEAFVDDDNEELDQRLFSVQDLIEHDVIKQYDLTGRLKETVGPFRRRNI